MGILATLLAWRVLPPDRDMRVRRNFDLPGFVVLAPALAMLLHSLEALASAEGRLQECRRHLAGAERRGASTVGLPGACRAPRRGRR